MTTTAAFRTIKSRLNGNSNGNGGIQTMTNNGFELKPSRICVKKPSTNHGFTNPFKKSALHLNHFFTSKTKASDQTNGNGWHQQAVEYSSPPLSPPLIFYPTAPTPTAEESKEFVPPPATNGDVVVHPSSKAHQSSCSDEEHQSVDSDEADESDHEQTTKQIKLRRLQKTRKPSNSSLQHKADHQTPPLSRSYPRKDEPLQQQRSSSNEDEENQESISRLNELNFTNRRMKFSNNRRALHFTVTTTATTTTTDEEINKQSKCQTVFDQSDSKSTKTAESNLSSPIPTMVAPVRKANRFQVKSIRKSQQPHILLAKATAAKSSNEDDCSVPNDTLPNLQARPTIIERSNVQTPTTDGDHPLHSMDTSENERHRVRFQVTSHVKRDSTVDEEKLAISSTATAVTLPTPAPASSNAPAKEEDDEEEDAVAKSPDQRFIKYATEIGRGAFKTVYRGLDTEASVAVAWCELQDFAQFDKQERARFKEEAEMLKKLQHQNIVRFYDFWEETNPRTNKKVIILVTELMTSGSLKGYIRKFKGQKEDKRINVMKKWCRQILKGLAYLHSRNPPVIHRDLKCDNVFISGTTGSVKIGDLGLATFKTQTFAKSMRGTMEFMAPEMFDEKYDELVDIYSFGLCMLEMITGEYPYIECKGPTAVIKRVTAGLKPDCYYKVESDDVREVIDCCIRTKKEERLSVHDLLQHSFFLEDNGLRIDLVRDSSSDSEAGSKNESIEFKLKIIDKAKRKALWTEHEAIRFRYNVQSDSAGQIADELIEKKYIFDDDRKFVIESIKDRLRAYQYEQIDRKAGVFTRVSKTSQPLSLGQQQPAPQQPILPLVTRTVPIPILPIPSLIQPTTVDVPQTPMIISVAEISQPKLVITTEPIPIVQLPELSSSVSGSAGSLEILDAALKKTFHKNHSHPTPTTANESSEPATPIINQEESASVRLVQPLVMAPDQLSQPVEESSDTQISDLCTHLLQSSTSTLLQSQSQPSTMSTSHPQQILSTPLLSIYPLSTDSIKPLLSAPLSSTTETIENSHLPAASSTQTNEPVSTTSTGLSDNSSTNPSQISGSLKQLNALLTNTFKNVPKSSGTAQNSDTETTNQLPMIPSVINENELMSHDSIIKSEESKRPLVELFRHLSISESTAASHSQPSTTSIVVPSSIQRNKSQPTTSRHPSQFDPFVSPERNVEPADKSLSNDDTIVAAPAQDLSEIKSMIAELSRALLSKMTVIEKKIDEHRQQTQQINQVLNETILPSLIDLSDIIDETSTNLDSRIRTKLESIRTDIRSTQHQQAEIKDLMEI